MFKTRLITETTWVYEIDESTSHFCTTPTTRRLRLKFESDVTQWTPSLQNDDHILFRTKLSHALFAYFMDTFHTQATLYYAKKCHDLASHLHLE